MTDEAENTPKAAVSGVNEASPRTPQKAQNLYYYNNSRREAVIVDGTGATVECSLLTGSAGTGKTFEIRRRMAADPNYGQMMATTGIAAINLGTITINSALGYFDSNSMEEAFNRGLVERRLMEIADTDAKNIIVDEASMMAKRQLELLYEAMRRVNERLQWKGKQPLGLILTGDFCQLPPVKEEWCFHASCWDQFEPHITRLTKCWRQDDQRFVEALSVIRRGDGRDGAAILKDIGVEFRRSVEVGFDGTTIIAKNDDVDRFNFTSQMRLPGKQTRVVSERWGKLRGEWEWGMRNGRRIGQIPPSLELRIGAYVMILTNDIPAWTYVNGDCGHIEDFSAEDGGTYYIKLVRNQQTVAIGPIIRENQQTAAPSDHHEQNRSNYASEAPFGSIYYSRRKKKWIIGGIRYHPIRLAYATTIHKSQSLSLDMVQVDLYNHFCGSPNMLYVALSRARTVAGLKLAGTPELLAERCKIDPAVIRWL